MNNFKPQDRRQKRFFLWLAIVALAVLIAVALRGALGAYFKERESRFYRTDASARLSAMEEREEALKADMERLNTKAGIEAEIRKRFNVAREGEKVVVLIDAPISGGTGDIPEEGIWQRIMDLLGF